MSKELLFEIDIKQESKDITNMYPKREVLEYDENFLTKLVFFEKTYKFKRITRNGILFYMIETTLYNYDEKENVTKNDIKLLKNYFEKLKWDLFVKQKNKSIKLYIKGKI